MQPFVHLHSHTEFSLLDGISRLPDMVRRAKELNQPALAITDHGNMYAAIYFYKECIARGVNRLLAVKYMSQKVAVLISRKVVVVND